MATSSPPASDRRTRPRSTAKRRSSSETSPSVSPASIGSTRQQPSLRAFLDDGRFPISNAHVERLLRVVSTFRKNSLFVGSLDAGERYANLLTILLNCELAGVNPFVYLVDVIDKIAADWPADRVTELLPRAWLAARQAEQQRPGQADVVAVT